MFFSSDYTKPHIISANFTSFNAADRRYLSAYGFGGKFKDDNPGFVHPDDSSILLIGDLADLIAQGPTSQSYGLVYRFLIPIDGEYEIHDTFAYSLFSTVVGFSVYTGDSVSSVNVVPSEIWQGTPTPFNDVTFIQSYYDTRPIIRSSGQGVSLGNLQTGTYVYFVLDSYD
eukprot:680429-Pleurochrysis_carterae.AAC.1